MKLKHQEDAWNKGKNEKPSNYLKHIHTNYGE